MRLNHRYPRLSALAGILLLCGTGACSSKQDDARPAATHADYRTAYTGTYRGAYQWYYSSYPYTHRRDTTFSSTLFVSFTPGQQVDLNAARIAYYGSTTPTLQHDLRPAVEVRDSAGRFTYLAYIDSATSRMMTDHLPWETDEGGFAPNSDSIHFRKGYSLNRYDEYRTISGQRVR